MRKKLLLVVVSVMSLSIVYAQSDDQVEYIKVKPFTPEHEIRAGYSPFDLLLGSIGIFSLQYSQKVLRWLEVGGAFTYSGEYSGRDKDTFLTIAPNVRFSWFNSKVVRFYSSLSVGLSLYISDSEPDGCSNGGSFVWPFFAFQLSPIGMSVGKKFFVFVEPLCFGTQGSYVIGGIGYRFPVKRQQPVYKYLNNE